ncbi:putative enzyme [Paraburkholderia piptadeniae]|uniref:Enzyme n=1 Tax=Paraburkholderia piptadeniae TaxID=1701573 RepID=A0A1N7SQ14_9BURK|nr:PhzF family phenazine biosynthesis protein [Paraburkholderia piptadeniae]SIT49432.1 putative enzyme [Paraburkholderia piptadeniae]
MNTTKDLPIWQVDAFSSMVFGGNPAAVVAIPGAWPPDHVLQAIAAENNVSETAFFRLDASPVPLRWFTPILEVPLCGHATLAAAAVMHEALGLVHAGSVVEFATASGPLYVRIGSRHYVLDFPARSTSPTTMKKEALERILGAAVKEVWESMDRYVCVLADEAAVQAVEPDLAAASALPLPGLLVTAPGDRCDFVSRYFAPAKGVPEDPVTGTSHCTLTPFWGQRLGKTSLGARQLSRRGGQIECSIHGDRVHLTGACRFYLRGSITVPAVA